MALVLVKEDGTGKSNANAYADVAAGDVYFEGHLYPTLWTAATPGQKAAALVMATRVIDAEYQFHGFQAVVGQGLQWPRLNCPDPDGGIESLGVVKSDVVPKAVIQATCEMAQELLLVDRTAAPPGEGVLMQHNTDFSETTYSKSDTRPIISHLAQALLGKLGCLIRERSGMVRLTRV